MNPAYCGWIPRLFGSFDVDDKTATHHIEACTLPAWTGKAQKRSKEFTGRQLVIPFCVTKLVWERLREYHQCDYNCLAASCSRFRNVRSC